jgi:hypothetical protein
MMSIGYVYAHVVGVTGRGKYVKVEHSEGKGGERAVEIPRFKGGSPRLCRLRTASFCPRWTNFDLY